MDNPEIKLESNLVSGLSKGNLIAFNSLYKMYSGRLYRFAKSYLKNEDEAEELVQEVFTIVWEKREDLNEDMSFKSFLFTITFNLIKRHFRSRAYMNAYLTSSTYTESDPSTIQNIAHDSLYQYISSLVDRMLERRRQIFVKSRFEGKSIKEISEELQISHKTVENQITEAIKFLRMNLNKYDK